MEQQKTKKMNMFPGLTKNTDSIISSVYKLLIAVICIGALTLAWFTIFKSGETEDFQFVSVEAADFHVGFSEDEYSYSISIDLPEDTVFIPLSGKGRTLYRPELPAGSRDPDEAYSWTAISYDDDRDDNTFYCCTLYFCADKPGYAALSEIEIAPLADPEKRQSSDYIGKDGNNVSVLGSASVERPIKSSLDYKLLSPTFTKDYIAAAARVYVENLSNSTTTAGISRTAIIIPNDCFELTYNESDRLYNNTTVHAISCSMNENGASVGTGYYYDGTSKVAYSSSDNVITESLLESSLSNAVKVAKLLPDGDGNYKGSIDLCIWVEGYDNEAIELLSDGKFTADIKFSFVSDDSGAE